MHRSNARTEGPRSNFQRETGCIALAGAAVGIRHLDRQVLIRIRLPGLLTRRDLFPTDTTVLLARAFTHKARSHTIASTTANYGSRSDKVVTM